MVASSRWRFQLKDGEQLYASSLPGNLAWIASANSLRLSQVGRGRLHPQHVCERRVRQPARNCRLHVVSTCLGIKFINLIYSRHGRK